MRFNRIFNTDVSYKTTDPPLSRKMSIQSLNSLSPILSTRPINNNPLGIIYKIRTAQVSTSMRFVNNNRYFFSPSLLLFAERNVHAHGATKSFCTILAFFRKEIFSLARSLTPSDQRRGSRLNWSGLGGNLKFSSHSATQSDGRSRSNFPESGARTANDYVILH